MKFDLKTVVLEGVDCSGKTTAFSKIHEMTGFKWNIHDRSTLSMLCYAIMYDRNVDHWRALLNEELSDFNNVVVVLMPSIDVIKERLAVRGDEFQTVDTIVRLHSIFENEVSKIMMRPNVLVCARASPDYEAIVRWLLNYERQTYHRLAAMMFDASRLRLSAEATFLKASWVDVDFKTMQTKALVYEPELEYYTETREKLIKKIQDERAGDNIYNAKQGLDSRRFVLAQETCISYAHFMYRDGFLNAHIVCRSSEMSRIFPNDIHFLANLGQVARREIGLDDSVPVKFYLTLDSAHVIFEKTY